MGKLQPDPKISFSVYKESFWEARAKSRRNLITAVILSFLAIQCLDFNVYIAVPGILILYLLYGPVYILDKKYPRSEKVDRFMYNVFISVVCVTSFLLRIAITLNWIGGDQLVVRVLLKRMDNGEVVIPSFFMLILPLIATSGGMDVTWAKKVTIINLILFLIQTKIMYMKGIENTLITNPLDLLRLSPLCQCSPFDPPLRSVGLMHDLFLITGLFYLCWTSCALSADIATKYVKLLSAGRSGDLALNHNLKNSIAGAACLLELDNQDQEQNGSSELRSRQKQVLNQLYRTMRWCTMRQVMVDVADGTYQSALSPQHVSNFLKAIAGDNMGISFVIREISNIVAFDEQMVRLALENAISNAIVHGDGSPIVLGSYLVDDKIAFYVENQVPESAMVTDETLREVSERARGNDRSTPFLPITEILSTENNPEEDNTNSQDNLNDMFSSMKMNLSTRSGLRHIDVACGGAGGYFDLRLGSKENSDRKIVVLTCFFPAKSTETDQALAANKSVVHLEKKRGVPIVHSPPAQNNDMPSHLKVCALDDSELICKGYQRLLLSRLGADIPNSVVCCPKTHGQVEVFVNKALNSDICILDQHIELNGDNTHQTVLGTDIARELRVRKFRGLVLIRSANSSELDAQEYMADGSVHGTLGKAESHQDMAAKICFAYAQHKRKRVDIGDHDHQHTHKAPRTHQQTAPFE